MQSARCDAADARLLTDAILLQPAVEGAAAHAELLRRQPDVAAVARQDLLDEPRSASSSATARSAVARPQACAPACRICHSPSVAECRECSVAAESCSAHRGHVRTRRSRRVPPRFGRGRFRTAAWRGTALSTAHGSWVARQHRIERPRDSVPSSDRQHSSWITIAFSTCLGSSPASSSAVPCVARAGPFRGPCSVTSICFVCSGAETPHDPAGPSRRCGPAHRGFSPGVAVSTPSTITKNADSSAACRRDRLDVPSGPAARAYVEQPVVPRLLEFSRVRATHSRVAATATPRNRPIPVRISRLSNAARPVRVLVSALPAMFESFTVHRMSSPTDPNPGRVLVADDQPDVLEALRWLLTGEGYQPQFVGSTEAVMERLRERAVRPAADGPELLARHHLGARRARADLPGARPRSGAADRGDDRLGEHRHRGRSHAPRRPELRAEAVGGRHAARDPAAGDRRGARRAPPRSSPAARARGCAADSARTAADRGAARRRHRSRRRLAAEQRRRRRLLRHADVRPARSGSRLPTSPARACPPRC